MARMMAGDAAANLEDGRRALELAEGRDEVVATAADIIYGHGLIGTGSVAEGEARLRAAAERARRLDRMPPVGRGPRPDRAHRAVGPSATTSPRRSSTGSSAPCAAPAPRARSGCRSPSARGWSMRRGRLVAALATGPEALELADQTGQISLRCVALAWLAEIEARLGREADARRPRRGGAARSRTGSTPTCSRSTRGSRWRGRARPGPDRGGGRAPRALRRRARSPRAHRSRLPAGAAAAHRGAGARRRARGGRAAARRVRASASSDDRARSKGAAFVAHSRGLLADDGEYEAWFDRGARAARRRDDPFSRGRTLLALGVPPPPLAPPRRGARAAGRGAGDVRAPGRRAVGRAGPARARARRRAGRRGRRRAGRGAARRSTS